MAVKLTKQINREMLSFADQHGKDRGKPIIVTLLPGDMISFRAKGTRASYSVFLGHCFRLAQILTLDQNYKAAVERYKARGSKRMRKATIYAIW